MNYTFKTPCHPAAGERVPQAGDDAYGLWFPTDDCGKVTVQMGREGMVNACTCMMAMLRDDPALMALVMFEAAKIESVGANNG